MAEYNLVRIVALSKSEANKILDELLLKRMLSTGYIEQLAAKMISSMKIAKKNMYLVTGIADSRKKQQILDIVRSLHSIKSPDVTFYTVQAANPDFIYTIKEEAMEIPQELRMLR